MEEHSDTTRAIKVLDRCTQIMPKEKVPYNFFSIYLADAYLKCGEFKKGNAIMFDLLDQYNAELIWYSEQKEDFKELLKSESERAIQAMQTIGFFASRYQQKAVTDKADQYLKKFTGGNVGQ